MKFKLFKESCFMCPDCDSTFYRTTNIGRDRNKWRGECKGCGFRWLRADDPKYFHDFYIPASEDQ